MNFLVFLLYYFISSIILFLLLFFLYKIYFKNYISEKLALKTLNDFFNTFPKKSITDININDNLEDNDHEKIPTYF